MPSPSASEQLHESVPLVDTFVAPFVGLGFDGFVGALLAGASVVKFIDVPYVASTEFEATRR